jgi:argininosuccinate lyase
MRAADELRACLAVLPPFVRGLEPNPARARELLGKGHILATEIADALSAGGTPFREAYAQVAALVELAEKKGVQVHELPESEAVRLAPGLTPGFLRGLTAEAAVEKRRAAGGTSLARAKESIEGLRRRLRADRGVSG